MNEQKARKLRRIECAHNRFTGVMLALGMPRKALRSGKQAMAGEEAGYSWYDNDYRERVRNFYIASFTSAPRPNDKTVKKFVRSYMRWLQHQHNTTLRKWEPEEL